MAGPDPAIHSAGGAPSESVAEWIPGSSRGMTGGMGHVEEDGRIKSRHDGEGGALQQTAVMRGLDPRIHRFAIRRIAGPGDDD